MADSHQKLAALDSALARPSERIADQPGADPFPHSSEALRLRNQALEEAVAARDPAMKSMAHNALALHYASEGAWELALPHADQADVSQQDALKLAGRLFHDETQGPFQKQVERDARDRRLRLLELSLDQGDLVQARQLLNHPGLKKEAPPGADRLRVERARVVFELRDGWARPAQGIERLTGIVEGFGKLGFLGEEAATGVLLSQLLVENGQTNEAMARLTRAEGPAMSVGDRYLRGVAAWARADAIAQEAMELYGGMEPVTRRRYDNRIEEAWKALDEAGAPEAALHSRQPGRLSPRLVLPLSHLWYLREF